MNAQTRTGFVSCWTGITVQTSLPNSLTCGRYRPLQVTQRAVPVRMANTSSDDESSAASTVPKASSEQAPSPTSGDSEQSPATQQQSDGSEKTKYLFGDEELVEPIYEEQVPGKIVLDETQLAKQKAVLDRYAEQLRQDRLEMEREAGRLFGFVPTAEKINGRFAMFFFVTGLLTEYWTDYTIPQQIDLLLRTLGII